MTIGNDLSDKDSGDEIPTTTLAAISVVPNGNGFTFALMDEDGTLHTRYVTRAKLTQVFAIIGEALQPGLIGDLTATLH